MPIFEEIGVRGARDYATHTLRLCLSLFLHKSRRTSHLATADS
jgi:hypothetical protein